LPISINIKDLTYENHITLSQKKLSQTNRKRLSKSHFSAVNKSSESMFTRIYEFW
jgi:hypothetical protein